MENEFETLAIKYANYLNKQLLIELDKHINPIRYAEPPSDEEKEASGNALWLQFRRRLALFICSNKEKKTRQKIGKLLNSGLIAFISQVGPIVLGSGILPGITTGVAATLAALLANDLLKIGIETFCKIYYENEI